MSELHSPRMFEEIKALTSLRFIAAFYVFLFHFHIRWPMIENPFVSSVLSQGAIGMSIFFMLSGYILAYSYREDKISIRHFYINRIAKIYPVYLVAALVTLPWIGISLEGQSVMNYLEAGLQAATLIFANLFVLQAWFPPMFNLWNNGGSWSISVEFFLYAVFPLAMLLIRNRSTRALLIVMFCTYILTILPGAVHLAFRDGTGFFYSMPIFRLSEFILGICAYLISHRIHVSARFLTCAFVGVIAFLILYLGFMGSLLPLYITHNWIVIPAIFLTLITLANPKTHIAEALSTRWMVWLGQISYCFYSFQVLIILVIIDYHDAITDKIPALESNLLLTALCLAVLIMLSWLGFRFIEEPMRRKIRSKYGSPSQITV